MLYDSLHHEKLVALRVLLVLPLHRLINPHLQLLHVLALFVLLERVEPSTRFFPILATSRLLFHRRRLSIPLQVQVELQIEEVIWILLVLAFAVGFTTALVTVIRLTAVVSQSCQRHMRFLETVLRTNDLRPATIRNVSLLTLFVCLDHFVNHLAIVIVLRWVLDYLLERLEGKYFGLTLVEHVVVAGDVLHDAALLELELADFWLPIDDVSLFTQRFIRHLILDLLDYPRHNRTWIHLVEVKIFRAMRIAVSGEQALGLRASKL